MVNGHFKVGKVLKSNGGRVVKTNISAEQALQIAKTYHKQYKIPGIIVNDINKSVVFYESIMDIDGFAWVVLSKLESGGFEGNDHFSLVISDRKSTVEYVLDHNGMSHAYHLDNYDDSMTDEEFEAYLKDDSDV
ncbi:hypothetical protein AV545_19880 [Paenibacillus jamilae]|nr:hypothetical protein AV545_19880 [Paenibacillus jamilae]